MRNKLKGNFRPSISQNVRFTVYCWDYENIRYYFDEYYKGQFSKRDWLKMIRTFKAYGRKNRKISKKY